VILVQLVQQLLVQQLLEQLARVQLVRRQVLQVLKEPHPSKYSVELQVLEWEVFRLLEPLLLVHWNQEKQPADCSGSR
jgi:hypothetical protein